MFGSKGLFGRRPAFQTPGIGDGLPGMPERLPDMASVPTTAGGMFGDAMPEPQRQGGGFFGKGGVGRAIAGTIGDVLLQRNGLEPMYGPQMQMQQVFAQRQAEAERQRAADLADYTAKKEIDARYRPEPEPDTFARTLLGAGIDPASPQGIELYRRRAESMANSQDEFVIVPIPGRGTYAGPKSGLPSVFGQGAAPVSEDDWNNASPMGGSGGNVGGGFRP